MAQGELLLPEGSVLLHIGPRKTATTGIQAGLADARDRLAEYGVSYPEPPRGQSWTHYDRTRAASPGWAVLRTAPPGFAVPDISVWEQFAEEVRERASEGLRVCVSSETFGNAADPDITRRIVDDLGGANVHVVYAARALHRLLPSHWQQEVKVNLETRPFEEWLQVVLSDDDPTAARRAFWYAHDLKGTLDAWLAASPPENLTVLATDDSDRRLIPATVERMLGLPDGFLDQGSGRSNASLGVDEIEILRLLNVKAREREWPTKLFTTLQRATTRGLNSTAEAAGPRRSQGLPAWALPAVGQLSRDRRGLIESSGVGVVGDPDCLLLPDVVANAGPETDPRPMAVETAAAAIGETMQASLREIKRARRAARQNGPSDTAPPSRERPVAHEGSTGGAIDRVKDRVRNRLRRR